MHLQKDKTSLGTIKVTFFRNIFGYFLPKKFFSPFYLIRLCTSFLLCNTGFTCSTKRSRPLNLAKTFYKSNTSKPFFPLLPLTREVDPLSVGVLPRDNPLYVADALAKQQTDSTNRTNIGLAQPSLLDNRLQNKPLPSKETSTGLPLPSLSLEQQDNPLISLSLQGMPSSPETSVVAKDNPQITDATNHIASKQPNVLAASKSEEAYPSNVKTGNNIKDLITLFNKKEKELLLKKGVVSQHAPNPKVTRSEETCDEYSHKDTEHIEYQEKIKAYESFINILYNQSTKIGKFINSISLEYNRVLEIIQSLIKSIQENRNIENAKIKLSQDNSNIDFENKIIKLIETHINAENHFIDLIKDKITSINQKLKTFNEELDKIMKDVSKQKDILGDIASHYLNLIINFQNQIERTYINEPRLEEIITINNEIKNMISNVDLEKSEEKTIELLKEIIERQYKNPSEIENMISNVDLENSEEETIEFMKKIIKRCEETNVVLENSEEETIERLQKIIERQYESPYEIENTITNLESIENNITQRLNTDKKAIEKITSLTEDIIQQAEKKKTELNKKLYDEA